MGYFYEDDYLEHHGILGQKWGVRRFQNEDGSLTSAGRSRYDTDANGNYKKLTDKQKHAFSAEATANRALAKVYGMNEKVYAKNNKTLSSMNRAAKDAHLKRAEEAQKRADERASKSIFTPEVKKGMAIGGAVILGTALAAYGGYKLKQINNVTTKGLSDTFESMAKIKYMDAAQTHGYSLENKMKSLSDYSSPTVKKMAKDNADYWKKVSDRSSAIGDQLRAKSKDTNNYTIKEKAEFIKEVKNNAKDFNWKKYTESADYAKAAAQANEDYLNELLRRNAKALGL